MEATRPVNTLTVPRPAESFRPFVVEEIPAPPVAILADDFESGQGDCTTGSDGAAGTAWELGTPTVVGPPVGHSPVYCFGTNLAGEYGSDADVWLRSPVIDTLISIRRWVSSCSA